jgi:hypothetical protein
MNARQTVIDMIVSTNRDVIESFDVVLDENSLDLSWPRAGDWDGLNTMVMAEAIHPKVESDQVYYYSRYTQALFEEALGNPEILIPETVTDITQLIQWFRDTYQVELDPAEMRTVQHNFEDWTITFFETSYLYVDQFVFKAARTDNPDLIPLEDILKRSVDGLYYPDGRPK